VPAQSRERAINLFSQHGARQFVQSAVELPAARPRAIPYGPPARNVAALASSGLAFYVFVAAVAWWPDRPVSAPSGAGL
jgi:hypothetical protein